MKVVVCVDDNLGISFNKRRVSKDIKIIEDINNNINLINILDYSKNLFKTNYNLVTELTEGYNFVETSSLLGLENNIEEITIYYFNRKYPSDLKLKLDLNQYNKFKEEEFVGNSHDKITKIIYRRNK